MNRYVLAFVLGVGCGGSAPPEMTDAEKQQLVARIDDGLKRIADVDRAWRTGIARAIESATPGTEPCPAEIEPAYSEYSVRIAAKNTLESYGPAGMENARNVLENIKQGIATGFPEWKHHPKEKTFARVREKVDEQLARIDDKRSPDQILVADEYRGPDIKDGRDEATGSGGPRTVYEYKPGKIAGRAFIWSNAESRIVCMGTFAYEGGTNAPLAPGQDPGAAARKYMWMAAYKDARPKFVKVAQAAR